MRIAIADPSAADVLALLVAHHDLMRSVSPEESCHVMAPDAVADEPGVTLFGAWDGDQLCGLGGLKRMGARDGELKSMHVAAAARGKGAGRALLDHLMQEARAMGIRNLWLETGTPDEFAPARAMYEKAGFGYCPPFGSYSEDPFSTFMTREI